MALLLDFFWETHTYTHDAQVLHDPQMSTLRMDDCEGVLTPLFPEPLLASLQNSTSSELDEGAIAVQVAPTLLVTCLWLMLETRRTLRPLPFHPRIVYVAGLTTCAALLLVAFRVFELLDCDGVDGVATWRWVAIVGVGAYSVLFVGLCLPSSPRIGVVASLGLAGAAVYVDWGLRGGFVTAETARRPALLMMALQQALCACAALCLVLLRRPLASGRARLFSSSSPPSGTTSHASTKASSRDAVATTTVTIDALARRAPSPPSCETQRRWSWFS